MTALPGWGAAPPPPAPPGLQAFNWSAPAENALVGARSSAGVGHAGAALCGVQAWWQGSYGNSWDNANVYVVGAGGAGVSVSAPGRALRVNYDNFSSPGGVLGLWVDGGSAAGEGLYTCANGGACVGPDACLCDSGYSGFDCSVPVCLNTSWLSLAAAPLTGAAAVAQTGCFNGGICSAPDTCACPTLPALLAQVYPLDLAPGQMTGWLSSTSVGGWAWAGRSLPGPTPPDVPYANQASFAALTLTLPGLPLAAPDCSMPICTQGWYNDTGCPRTPASNSSLITSQASRVGCFVCANGGTCVCVGTACVCARKARARVCVCVCVPMRAALVLVLTPPPTHTTRSPPPPPLAARPTLAPARRGGRAMTAGSPCAPCTSRRACGRRW
jgi:hypothetical protein